MKVLFRNFTTSTVYIAIVDYHEETEYLSEPFVFELEANQECFYESTPKHFFGAWIAGRCGYLHLPDSSNVKRIITVDYSRWSVDTRTENVDHYLTNSPQIRSATLSNDDNAKVLRNFMFDKLADRYYNSLDIKEPACSDV
jgi:hypothetical protein